MSEYTFDTCWKKDGASSDRGWMYLDDVTYGNYIDYGVFDYHVKRGEKVHAVVFDRAKHSMWSSSTNTRWK